MGFFRGSTPLEFILFCLENQTTENTVVPTTSHADNPDMAVASNHEPQSQLLPDFSPYSQDSEPDVTAYAETVVRRMEQTQEPISTSDPQ